MKDIFLSDFVVTLKLHLVVQQPTSVAGLLNKSSCLAPAFGVVECMIVKDIIFVTWLKSHLVVQQPTSVTGLLNKSSCLAPALGFIKCIIVKDIIFVRLCCDT